MDSIFPFVVICILPLIWTGLSFAAGRWSMRYRISVQPHQTPYQPDQNHQGGYSDAYENFEEA